MPNQFKLFNPSSVPELDVAKMRARRLALGLTAWECSMSLFNEAGMWEQFEAGNVASLESGAVFFFADLLLCRYDDLLTRRCRIDELPEMLKVIDSSRVSVRKNRPADDRASFATGSRSSGLAHANNSQN